ncbi:MAG: hypothetical protein PHC84_05940, partial [Clostridia bacterium]|nr:hypothetical protein [Clostridia bacterium]
MRNKLHLLLKIKIGIKKLRKKIAVDRGKSLAIGLVALALISFAIVASTTPLVFSADVTFETSGGSQINGVTMRK